jgi:hypothetical protein
MCTELLLAPSQGFVPLKTCRPVLRSNYRHAACINSNQFNSKFFYIINYVDHCMLVRVSPGQ